MNRRGVSLLEAMLSLALIFLVLGAVTDLLTQANRTRRFSEEQDRGIEAMATLDPGRMR